jgi:propionaldehyde dehydrogenase
MALTEQQIRGIVDDIVKELAGSLAADGIAPSPAAGRTESPATAPRGAAQASSTGRWLCDTVEEAVGNAKAARLRLADMGLEQRGEIIAAMRKAAIDNAVPLARLACEETGYGRVEDKIAKNLLAAKKTPGIEDLCTTAHTGDNGMMIVEQAPFGVIASVTPSTNPTATVINNCITMIAAGNAVVFNPHPAAKGCSQKAIGLMHDAAVSAGGPAALVTAVREPTLESGLAVMSHPDIPLLSVTGGEAVVSVAMKTGKKVIAAGPGNPPVIVDDTANIGEAAKNIVDGACFDNNVLCIAEKEVFAFDGIVDALMAEMEKNGAFRVGAGDAERIVNTVLIRDNGKYVINRKYVGRDASVILRDSGVAFSGNPRLVIAEVDRSHPFIMVEMLMPVLGLARVRDIEEAVAEACRAEQGCRHSAMIHSANVHNMSLAARRLNTTIFVKNAPSLAGLGFGGEGCTTLTIATPTGEGVTTPRSFTRQRRCVLAGDFRIV